MIRASTACLDDLNGTVELVQVLDDKYEPIPGVNETSAPRRFNHAVCPCGPTHAHSQPTGGRPGWAHGKARARNRPTSPSHVVDATILQALNRRLLSAKARGKRAHRVNVCALDVLSYVRALDRAHASECVVEPGRAR